MKSFKEYQSINESRHPKAKGKEIDRHETKVKWLTLDLRNNNLYIIEKMKGVSDEPEEYNLKNNRETMMEWLAMCKVK
ncbi:hypothetical protein [Endozoicomonas lisbonensis]|uniref:Uncharacterized protein n=1 Tax=Endozoicomonas lisbonensis TaxID=3120522 RepID=A0ABV2SD03_9GAMM